MLPGIRRIVEPAVLDKYPVGSKRRRCARLPTSPIHAPRRSFAGCSAPHEYRPGDRSRTSSPGVQSDRRLLRRYRPEVRTQRNPGQDLPCLCQWAVGPEVSPLPIQSPVERRPWHKVRDGGRCSREAGAGCSLRWARLPLHESRMPSWRNSRTFLEGCRRN